MFKFKVAIAFLAIGFFIGFNEIRVEAADNEDIIEAVSKETSLDEKFIQYIYAIGLQNDKYMDRFPNVYKDTVKKSEGTILNLGNTKYQSFKNVKTTGLDRPSAYFLPDSIYSVSYDIKTLMQYNYYKDRGGFQKHFDSYNEDVKQFIIFCESIIEYCGEDCENFIRAYEIFRLGYTDSIENALIFNNINDELIIKYISSLFTLERVQQVDNINTLKDTYEMPYIIGYTTQENMLEAAISLVGKVRYTWAGGHAMTSNIKGINPVWKEWESLYRNSEEGSNSCIKPSSSWCPIHGYNEDERCINYDAVSDYNSYLLDRADILGIEELKLDKYKNKLAYIDTEDGTAHRLDGLDCSGYASWIFNQISNKYNIDSSAMYFTRQSGIEYIKFGNEMQPGDIFAWTSHIVIILGKVGDNSKVYVTIEQTPNTLKFGTVYYSGYKQSDLDYAMQIAREANLLIGNVTEEPHSYCMNNVGHYSVELANSNEVDSLLGNVQKIETKEVPIEDGMQPEEYSEPTEDNSDEIVEDVATQTVTTVQLQYIDIGRFTEDFLDYDSELVNGKTFRDATALEILQYIIKKMPLQYISGYPNYEGELFDISTVSTEVGTTIVRSKNEE